LQKIDFYIPECNLCIEVDGSFHFYGLTENELATSILKYRLMDKVGLNVLRLVHHKFKNSKVVNKEAILIAVDEAIK